MMLFGIGSKVNDAVCVDIKSVKVDRGVNPVIICERGEQEFEVDFKAIEIATRKS